MNIKRWISQAKKGLGLVTIEPTMLLYMLAFMTTSVVEQAFFVHKACTVNHNYNATICDNISKEEYHEFKTTVQVTVSDFQQWNDVAGHAGQIIMALFMGAWSDKRGRKLPLLMGLIGKFYYSSMIVVNAWQTAWPVEYIIYTATLPMTITGADVAIFAAAFSYISDITVAESRTLRVTILEVCYLASMPTGIALGKYLFSNVTNRSYAIMFIINASMLALSIIYTLVRLKWRTNEQQRPLTEAKNIFTDFFDYKHVKETFKTVFKKRILNQRLYLFLFMIAMANYTFQRDEKDKSYLYFQLVLNWTFDIYSTFRTYQSAIQDVVLLVAIPFMTKLLDWRDTVIAMVGAVAHCVGRIFYATARVDWLVYLGGAFVSLGPVVAPVIRSMVSKLVAGAERGKIFSVLAVADNAVPIISSTLYNQVYKLTINNHPGGIFYLTIASQLVVFAIFLGIHVTTSDQSLLHREEESAEKCLPEGDEHGASSQQHQT